MIRGRDIFVAGGIVLLILGILALISAIKQQTAKSGQLVTFNSMQEDSENLDQLKTGPLFSAEVLSVHVSEQTNIAQEHGITNGRDAIRNLYAVRLRGRDGQTRFVAGMNATDGQLRVLKRLKEGQVYDFPGELLEQQNPSMEIK